MSLLSHSLRDGDWIKLRQILQHISSLQLGVDSTPTFAGLTLNDLTLSKLCEVAAGLNVLRVTGLQVDGTAMTGTLRGAYIDVSNGSTAATGTIRAMELKARTEAPGDSGSNVNVLEGLSISADSKGHSVTTMRAAEFILDGSTGGTITEAVGLRIANNLQANKATTSYGLQIYRDSFDYTADVILSGGGTIGGSSGVMQLSSAGLLEIVNITAIETGTFANIVIENTSLPAGNSTAIKVNHRKATAGGVLFGIDIDVRHDVSGSSSKIVPLNAQAYISDGTFADAQRLLDFYGDISGGSFTSIRGIQNQIAVSSSPTFSADIVGMWNYISVAATVTVGEDIIGQDFNVINSGATVTGDTYILKLAGTGVDWGIWDSSGGDWALDADNQKLLFGAGQNSSIYYDSTDLIIKSDEVDTGSCIINSLIIDKDANLTTAGMLEVSDTGPIITYGGYNSPGTDYRKGGGGERWLKMYFNGANFNLASIESNSSIYMKPSNSTVGAWDSAGFNLYSSAGMKFGQSGTSHSYLTTNYTTQNNNGNNIFALMWGLISTDWGAASALASRYLLFCDDDDIAFDFGHGAQANSTIFLHSANQTTDEWISFTHDQTNGVIDVGTGIINIHAGAYIGDGGTTNYTEISATGDIKPKGSAFIVIQKASGEGIKVDQTSPTFGWRDLLGPIIPRIKGGTAPAFTAFRGTNVKEYAFQAGDIIEDITFHIPHDYVEGTDLHLHLHWGHNGTAISGSLVVDYFLIYAKGHGQAIFNSEIDITETISTPNVATQPQWSHEIDEIQITNDGGDATHFDRALIEPDGVIKMALITTTIPTITGSATSDLPYLFTVDVHYQSTNIATKAKVPDFYT